MKFCLQFPHLVSSLDEFWCKRFEQHVEFVEIIVGKPILFLWPLLKIHLCLYCESVWHFEIKECLCRVFVLCNGVHHAQSCLTLKRSEINFQYLVQYHKLNSLVVKHYGAFFMTYSKKRSRLNRMNGNCGRRKHGRKLRKMPKIWRRWHPSRTCCSRRLRSAQRRFKNLALYHHQTFTPSTRTWALRM